MKSIAHENFPENDFTENSPFFNLPFLKSTFCVSIQYYNQKPENFGWMKKPSIPEQKVVVVVVEKKRLN